MRTLESHFATPNFLCRNENEQKVKLFRMSCHNPEAEIHHSVLHPQLSQNALYGVSIVATIVSSLRANIIIKCQTKTLTCKVEGTTTLRKTTLTIMTFSITMLSIYGLFMTLSITLSIMCHYVEFRISQNISKIKLN
jgi:hypothetical protein